MIVAAEGSDLRLVTQPDHARFAAQLLELWRRPEMREHPRRDALLKAVREHDSGRPYDFRALPGEHRREVWRRGVERYADEEPYLALLAARHSLELHRGRRGQPGWADYLEELEARLPDLLEAADMDEVRLAEGYPWLDLADSLSLTVCLRSPDPVRRGTLTARLRQGELQIDPFPLAGATTFEIPCRRIADRRYRGEADLAAALGAARWERLSLRCRPRPEAPPQAP